MKRILFVLCCLFLLLGTGILIGNAQPNHSASASVPHAPLLDCSPTVATCPPTPTPQPGGNNHNPGDPDGDGIPNGIDQCPDEGGPSSNSGCPIGRSLSAGNPQAGLVTPDLSAILLPFLPTSLKVCALATLTGTPVNVRNQPSIHADIIGTLDPKTLYYPDSALITLDGSKWYAILQPYGWVAASAVRTSPGCPYTLATYKQRPISDQNPLPLSYVNVPHIVLDKGDTPSSDQPNGYCGVGYGIDITGADGLNNAIHIAFGDGSVQPSPAQGCITLNSDGHSFKLCPPGPPIEPAAQPFCIHFSVGVSPDNPNEVVLMALLQAPSLPGEPPPDPDKTGVTFTWSFVPPGPCKPSAQSCAGSVRNFTVGWSQPGAANPGVAFSWNIIPPGPCKPGDASCTGATGKQGFLMSWGLTPPGPPIKQPFSIDFFPNGFDPSIGGFTQIENQPGGSGKGDQYGFTQIENQPLTGQIAIDAALPAVQ